MTKQGRLFPEFITARYYDFYNSPLWARERVNINLRFALPARRVLEVGAGTGRLTLPMAERGIHVVAIDPSHEMLQTLWVKLAQRPELFPYVTPILVPDTKALDLKERFPLVTLFGVFEYITTDEDRVATLRKLRDHLTDDGRLLIEADIGLIPESRAAGSYKIRVGQYELVFTRNIFRTGPQSYNFNIISEALLNGEKVEESSILVPCRDIISAEYFNNILHEGGFVLEEEYTHNDVPDDDHAPDDYLASMRAAMDKLAYFRVSPDTQPPPHHLLKILRRRG